MFLTIAGWVWVIIYDVRLAPKVLDNPALLADYNYMSVALLSLDIINTWYCTGLICYRLYSILRQKRTTADALNDLEGDITAEGSYRKIIRVLVQSGMLFSVTELAFLFCAATGSQMNTPPPKRNMNGNLQQPPNEESGSSSMPVFCKLVKEESTTDQVGTQSISKSTACEDSMQQTISYLAAFGGQSNQQSVTNGVDIEQAASYLVPYIEQPKNPSNSRVADHNTA
ncbi:hypothetical protein FRB94_013442 [Tulasnella sp. JGI-2019a]|nr:hypothetical protein FRB93_011191 [Tulasnella sp. JGI-2019a]KAG8990361.1 hypothetical protein FRB94_013442 [Tulasnella sp. JGI-2019a]